MIFNIVARKHSIFTALMKPQRKYMERCLQLAEMGLGSVSPNPLVGCVIVSNDRIIGEGYHRKYGGPHAEVHALQSTVGPIGSDAVMYVTLEPCNHYGKTPPCTDLILKSGIRNVVVACRDVKQPFDGDGAGRLQREGLNVVTGFMEDEARQYNRRFFTYHEKKRPYIILKWAQTADGFIGHDGKSASRLVVSNHEAHILVHRWRTEEDAILAGANTLLADNPQLTSRLWKGKNPVRVVLDRDLSLPSSLNVFKPGVRVLLLNERKTGTASHIELMKTRCRSLKSILDTLNRAQIQSLLVEGGTKTLEMFLKEDCYDELRVIVSPHQVHSGVKAPVADLSAARITGIGNNTLFHLIKKV
jgi:diaminohydroxyphosphoribosylaminopyrimidine deaminase/5-amino-6-(5-phosphoribosylamino)uracil reductase